MDIHMGKLLERVIRKKGLNISGLAREIGVNRRSLYNWFEEKNIKVEVLQKVSEVIDHDFSAQFPNILGQEQNKKAEVSNATMVKDKEYWKDKYILLLERYSELLSEKEKDA